MRFTLALLLQAGLLLAGPGQRKITGDGSIRESGVDDRQVAVELTNGSAVNFTLPTITRATLFNGNFGYFVRVPAGATELRLQLITGSDIDLYANFGSDVSIGTGGVVMSDHSTELIPSKDLRIGLSGSPGLRAGTYFIGLAAFNPTDPNTGTIRVTITNPNPGTVNDLNVVIGTEDNSSCPTTKRLPVTVRDAAGTLVSGLTGANFSMSEGTVAKTGTVTCPSAGQCTLAYAPTDPTRSADVTVTVNVNNQRTGSARKTVGPCTTSGGGGTSGRTAVELTLDITNSATSFGGNGWTTSTSSGYWTLGVSLPSASAPLLNAANRTVNLTDGTYYLYGEPGAMGSHARLIVVWSDGAREEAIFATAPLTTTTTWTRLSGPANLSMASTGLTNLNKIASGSGIAAGGAADLVFRLDIGAGGGGGGGGSTGPLTVAVGNEDNSACPATKKLFVSVVDNTGLAVAGLGTSNFNVTENGVARPVTAVSCSSSGGGSSAGSGAVVAIVIDTSGSLNSGDLANEKAAAVNLVNSLGASDQVAVYNFDSAVTRKQAFTTNKQLAITAINALAIGGSTALYQALFMAAQDIGAVTGRRAIVLMTDGSDNQGGKTLDEAINAAKAARAPVYAVGFGSGINETVMRRMGTETGGTFTRGATSAELQALLQTVATNITSQCEVSYTPGDPTREADVVVNVVAGTRTGSGTRRVSACTVTGGGGGTGTGCPSSTNIALTGTASQSSNAFGGPANLGNNGVLNEPNGYGFHTDAGPNQWWQVDFGSVRTICEVRMYNRSDGFFDRAKTIRVLISTNGTDFETVYSHNGTSWGETGAPLTVPVASRTARFVRVQLAESNYFHLREVEVYGGTGTGGGGGGGSTGPLTVTVGNENNTACPVTKKLIVSVVDNTGLAVSGLTASNFTVTENGVARPVTAVSCSSSGGGSAGSGAVVAIVIDLSTSLSATDLVNEKAAAVGLVNSLGASDQVAVYSFGSTVTLRQAFTTNKQLAITAINALATSGSTALYQALFMAAQDIGAVAGRRAIVLMTDGADNQGGKTIDEAINAAKAAKAPVYAVGFGSGINETVMRRMGTETGGTFTRGATSAELQALLQAVATNITSQCEISYTPGDPTREADVVVNVVAGTRTGSGTRRVSACTSTGGGGGGGGGGSTTGPGWNVTAGCNYFVTPLSSTPVAAQTTGIIRVTTADNCEWNAHSEVAWIRITAVRNANGRGSGAVDYIVTANTDPVTRTGRIITAAQPTNVTQAAGTSCAVTISPTAARAGPGSGGSTVLVQSTTATCAWTARTNDAWLKITGTTGSGNGNGRITYTWDSNGTTSSRIATMTVNGQPFTLTQDAGSIPGTPTLTETGIVNSASGVPPSLPGGALAQGSFFTIFAAGVGPTPPQQVEQFPLPTNLGGTLVQIRQGTRAVDCYLVYTSNTQINGIIPSNAPLGDAEMIVTFNGRASRPVAVRIARNNFGIFATSQGRGPGIIQNFQTQLEQPLNTRSASAKPRQVVILWGTGAGPITTADNVAPPAGNLPFPFEMTIGGKPATLLYNGRAPCCSGVDQIVAEVPADAPAGCFVPVQVKAGDVWSNVVTMAIDTNGQTCSDPTNPASAVTSTGGKIGVIALTRLSASLNVAGQGQQNLDADIGIAAFPQIAAGGDLGFNMLTSMPPSGTCQAYAGVRDISDLLGGAFGGPVQTTGGTTFLDGGTALRIAGPGGTSASLDKSTNGTYMGILGGSLPIPGSTATMPLNAGSYTITGSGGKDVGAFSASVTLRPGLTWTNRTSINSIDRKTPFSLNWTGGTAGEEVLIVGYGTDQKVKASSGFLCSAPAGAGTFTIPASVMANLPAVPVSGDLSEKFGLLGIISFRAAGMASPFQAPGLNIGLVMGAQVDLKSIEIK